MTLPTVAAGSLDGLAAPLLPSTGAALPVILKVTARISAGLGACLMLLPVVAVGSLMFLALLGMVGAKAGGADVIKPMIRVTFWGALAMAMTTGIGAVFGKIL